MHLYQTFFFRFFLLCLILCLLLVADITLGSVLISISDIFRLLLGWETAQESWEAILFKIRVPRALTAILAGSGLAVSGLMMQTLFRNPLASPSILGISSGASLGVATLMLSTGISMPLFALGSLGIWKSWLLIGAAIMGAFVMMSLVLLIALSVRDNVILLIVGMMIGNFTISIVGLWQYFSSPEQIQDFLLWTFGSLGGVTDEQLIILLVVISMSIIGSFSISKSLNTLLLGENYAQSMGLPIVYTRIQVIFLTSLLAGSITAFCGPIGFIGIVVPHLSKIIFKTSNHFVLIPATVLLGSCLLLFCDILSKLPQNQWILPINAITGLLGAPLVIWIILEKRNLRF